MAIAYLIHGFVGVGKTTYATELEQTFPAMRFSIDDWMTALYGQNPPEEKFEDYHERTTGLIWSVAARVLELDRDVILDFGFWSRASRDEARHRIEALGAEAVLYGVACSEDVMRSRVLERTALLPEGSFYIDERAMESFRERFEPLSADEPHVLVRTDR